MAAQEQQLIGQPREAVGFVGSRFERLSILLGRLARTFNALIDRLQKAIEEMRRFTADAAHELRTPLAVLRSGIDVALRAPRTAEEYRQALEAAADEANRLTRLADQLLFLSRQEAGMMQIDREEMRLDALLKDVAEQFAGRADEAGVTLTVEPLEPWTVRGDDIRLSQVFYNVLDNAIKYTPRGGRVTVRGRAVDDRVEIEIEDTGSGILPEHVPHVFKRFYRVEQSRNAERGGSGLGLAIAQSAIEAHGGTISIREHPGPRNGRHDRAAWRAGRPTRPNRSSRNQPVGESDSRRRRVDRLESGQLDFKSGPTLACRDRCFLTLKRPTASFEQGAKPPSIAVALPVGGKSMNRRYAWNRGGWSLALVVAAGAILCVVRPLETVRAQDGGKRERPPPPPPPGPRPTKRSRSRPKARASCGG